jgi:hypothetical protein
VQDLRGTVMTEWVDASSRVEVQDAGYRRLPGYPRGVVPEWRSASPEIAAGSIRPDAAH